jgi:uncharacterized membrane protein YdcZ (DUF606 family)
MAPLHLSDGSAAAGILASMMPTTTRVVRMKEAACWWQGAGGSLGGCVVSAAPLPSPLFSPTTAKSMALVMNPRPP